MYIIHDLEILFISLFLPFLLFHFYFSLFLFLFLLPLSFSFIFFFLFLLFFSFLLLFFCFYDEFFCVLFFYFSFLFYYSFFFFSFFLILWLEDGMDDYLYFFLVLLVCSLILRDEREMGVGEMIGVSFWCLLSFDSVRKKQPCRWIREDCFEFLDHLWRRGLRRETSFCSDSSRVPSLSNSRS